MHHRLWNKCPTHSLLNPHGLTARKPSHLLDIGEVEFSSLGIVIGGEEILLPWFSQQTFHDDLLLRQAVLSIRLLEELFRDPAPVHEHRRALFFALERGHDQVSVGAIAHSRPDEHLLIVSEMSRGEYPAVIEVFHGRGVDLGRQR